MKVTSVDVGNCYLNALVSATSIVSVIRAERVGVRTNSQSCSNSSLPSGRTTLDGPLVCVPNLRRAKCEYQWHHSLDQIVIMLQL